MATDNNPNEKVPGEKPEGTPHFNPGNMSGKKIGQAKAKDPVDGESPPEEKSLGDSSDGHSASSE